MLSTSLNKTFYSVILNFWPLVVPIYWSFVNYRRVVQRCNGPVNELFVRDQIPINDPLRLSWKINTILFFNIFYLNCFIGYLLKLTYIADSWHNYDSNWVSCLSVLDVNILLVLMSSLSYYYYYIIIIINARGLDRSFTVMRSVFFLIHPSLIC